MKDTALQLESRFSMPPNSLGYCGKETAGAKFKDCIINGKCDGVKEEVTKFIVLHPYLQFLSHITGLDKFDYKLIEGYWLGNSILRKATKKDYFILLDYFKKQGVPKFFVEELKNKVPKNFLPNHLFQVLHVGVGKASGSVPYNIETINNCMIRWGEVEKINDQTIITGLNSLKQTKPGKFGLTKIKQTIPFNPLLVVDLKTGDTVAVHWNMVIKKLTKPEITKLEFWTNEVIKSQF